MFTFCNVKNEGRNTFFKNYIYKLSRKYDIGQHNLQELLFGELILVFNRDTNRNKTSADIRGDKVLLNEFLDFIAGSSIGDYNFKISLFYDDQKKFKDAMKTLIDNFSLTDNELNTWQINPHVNVVDSINLSTKEDDWFDFIQKLEENGITTLAYLRLHESFDLYCILSNNGYKQDTILPALNEYKRNDLWKAGRQNDIIEQNTSSLTCRTPKKNQVYVKGYQDLVYF